MFVIASAGRCVINGLNQVKVYEDRVDAMQALANMMDNGVDCTGYEVQAIQIIKAGSVT
tara:strand:- start:526 stop:702 length:177 start_codon:yes stop_codon:yes gene_type:complete